MGRKVRLAVRGLILHRDRLLLVNAWPGGKSDLLCAPGGGVEPHQSLPDNLRREIHEETGLTVSVGPPVLVNEFHDPDGDFHQVDIYFRCSLMDPDMPADWTDPEGVVTERHWVTREDLSRLRVKPDSLADVAWDHDGVAAYDPLEPILR
ncbi:NUDIX domain-containing protein [Alphaproteobacteria bacterium GH1-50]|uniref:NUDIX domain-containing protein n=1 Tax=Kangsaoukella pontilimi TaxID=2691042 RepID=A0A7C9NF25_9RHOB|nr:NUDIX domain-containing protein [Kangsaoukella pontilimi]MXQ08539.1 NUDIX domain-containing protein [Kangsaoukella pontilimi]